MDGGGILDEVQFQHCREIAHFIFIQKILFFQIKSAPFDPLHCIWCTFGQIQLPFVNNIEGKGKYSQQHLRKNDGQVLYSYTIKEERIQMNMNSSIMLL